MDSSSSWSAPQYDDVVDLDIFDSSTSSDLCDRRLSRAARKVIRKHFLHAQHGRSTDPAYNEETSQIDVWSLLDDMVGNADATSCPLLPSRDAWRHDEEHTTLAAIPSYLNFAYPNHALQQRRKASPERLKHWLQCGYCGKIFTTQYYLDIHMHTHHHHAETDGVVCPADDWCRVVGLANCHEQALLDEPFYGRGSGGWGADRKFVEHKWRKEAHSIPCNADTIRAECRSVLKSCDVGLANDICGALDCPTHHVWQSFADSISLLVPDHWHQTWIDESKHHMGYVILVFVVVVGLVVRLSKIDIFQYMYGRKEQNKLLRKGPGSGRYRLSNRYKSD